MTTVAASAGKRKTYTGTSPPLFSKKAMQWGKKWPVQMNLPFFAVEAYVPGGGGPESGRKKIRKMPSGRYRYKNLLFQQAGSQPFRCRNRRVFCFGGRKISLAAGDFWGWPQNRRNIAATTAASRRSRAFSPRKRPRDTKLENPSKRPS